MLPHISLQLHEEIFIENTFKRFFSLVSFFSYPSWSVLFLNCPLLLIRTEATFNFSEAVQTIFPIQAE